MSFNTSVNYFVKRLFSDNKVDFKVKYLCRIVSVYKTKILRYRIIENYKTNRTIDYTRLGLSLPFAGYANLNGSMEPDDSVLICHQRLIFVTEHLACALFILLDNSKVI